MLSNAYRESRMDGMEIGYDRENIPKRERKNGIVVLLRSENETGGPEEERGPGGEDKDLLFRDV